MKPISVRRFCLAVFFCITTGCSSFSNPTFDSQVSTKHEWLKVQQSTASRTFIIEPIVSNPSSSAETTLASAAIATGAYDIDTSNIVRDEVSSGMERQGFDLASSSAPPNYWVEVQYSQNQFTRYKQRNTSYPYVSYGSNREMLGVLIVSAMLNSTQSKEPNNYEVYQQKLSFTIRTKPKTQASTADVVYEATAVTESLKPNLEKALPWLVLSVFDDFPKDNGSIKEVKIPYNTNRYYAK